LQYISNAAAVKLKMGHGADSLKFFLFIVKIYFKSEGK
jgi:hypothetical protein